METDEALYYKIRRGNLDAFDVLYERYKKGLFRFIYSYLKNEEQSEDVFQEAFMQVLHSNEIEFQEGSFRSWLYFVARNIALNRLRSFKRGEKAHTELRLNPERTSFESAEMLVMNEDRARSLKAAAKKLPENLAEVLTLRLSGLPNQEIAQALDIPIGTVKSRFHAIVQFIKKEITL
jgi:RNA polymerase sigma-70 factor (ECF subfamily)